MLKKFLFILVIFVLFSFAACVGTGNTPVDTDGIPASIEDTPADMRALAGTDNSTLTAPGGMFCTADLPEGEVLTVYVSGDIFIADSINEMLLFAAGSGEFRNDVVRAEILDERVEWLNVALPSQHEGALPFRGEDPGWDFSDSYEPHTIYRILVLEVFQGEAEVGSVLEVAQSGGRIDNVHLVNEHFVPLVPGEDFLLFLSSISWMTNEEWPAALTSRFQGVYRFPGPNDGIRMFGLSESLEPVQPLPDHLAEANLPLTLHDLAEMQRENFGEVSKSFQEVLQQ